MIKRIIKKSNEEKAGKLIEEARAEFDDVAEEVADLEPEIISELTGVR
jgi:hypothetical protein